MMKLQISYNKSHHSYETYYDNMWTWSFENSCVYLKDIERNKVQIIPFTSIYKMEIDYGTKDIEE